MELFPHRGVVEAYQCSRLAVGIRLLRTTAQPGHHFIFGREYHAHAQARHFTQWLLAGGEVHGYLNLAVGSDFVESLQISILFFHAVGRSDSSRLSGFCNFDVLQFGIASGVSPGAAAYQVPIWNIIIGQRAPEVGLQPFLNQILSVVVQLCHFTVSGRESYLEVIAFHGQCFVVAVYGQRSLHRLNGFG